MVDLRHVLEFLRLLNRSILIDEHKYSVSYTGSTVSSFFTPTDEQLDFIPV